jgi:cytochrome P450
MTRLFFKEAAILFGIWIIYTQIKAWFRWRSLRKWGEKYGAGDVPVVKNQLPWGLEQYSIIFTGLRGMMKSFLAITLRDPHGLFLLHKNELLISTGRDILDDLIRRRYRLMGTNTFRAHGLFNSSLLSTADPANIQAILSTKFQDFELDRANFHDLLGQGIFTSDGDKWSHFRAQLKPQFTRDQVSDLEAADRHLKIMLNALPEEGSDGWVEAVDLKPLLYRFTMDTSTEFLVGSSVNSQTTALNKDPSAKEEMDFAYAMNFAQEFISRRLRLGSLYWLKTSTEFRKACQTVKIFTGRFVSAALEQDQARKSTQQEKYVLLDALIDETRDPIELRDQILQVLLAGRDTTSALLCWVLILLSRDASAYAELRSTIISHFGTDSTPTTELDFASLKACKPLTHVIFETLRLYPLVPMNARAAIRDTILPTGGGPDFKKPIAMRKGEKIIYSTYVMQRRPDIWGADAEEFKPARWEGRKLGWEMIPFSGGPRVCIGRKFSDFCVYVCVCEREREKEIEKERERKCANLSATEQYALNEASFVLVKILQRYDKIDALDMGPGGIKKEVTLTLSPANGVNVRLHRASC